MEGLRNHVVVILVTCTFTFWASGCGTLLYPERLNSTPSKKLDAKTVILDCAWLLAGVIPGIVALAVDFVNDTIYLSEDELKAETGDEVSVNIRGRAPMSCEVSLRLVEEDGSYLNAPVRAHVLAGEKLPNALRLRMPAEIEEGGAKLVLAVDGNDQVVWYVRPPMQ